MKTYKVRRFIHLPKFLVFAGTTVGFSGLILTALLLLSQKPPIEEMNQFRIKLAEAKKIESDRYLPILFQQMESQWQIALAEWQNQNDHWFFLRDFDSLRIVIQETSNLASHLIYKTELLKDSLSIAAKMKLKNLQTKIAETQQRLAQMPLNRSLRNKFIQGELYVHEADNALKRHDYLSATEKLNDGEKLIGQTKGNIEAKISQYLANLPMWKKWINDTIIWSKKNKDVIVIVDKLVGNCLVYDSGALQATYPIELGPNWIGHKKQKGDGATPEGKYKIINKKGNGQTKYYKALHINYPNDDDLHAFQLAQKKGSLPANAHIGGLIEIHGAGGMKGNWTEGCVALANADMDKLFAQVKIGTPVTIVGSVNGIKDNSRR